MLLAADLVLKSATLKLKYNVLARMGEKLASNWLLQIETVRQLCVFGWRNISGFFMRQRGGKEDWYSVWSSQELSNISRSQRRSQQALK